MPLPCLGSSAVGSKADTLVELSGNMLTKPTLQGILSVSRMFSCFYQDPILPSVSAKQSETARAKATKKRDLFIMSEKVSD